jgi:acetyl esterase/lipase
MSKIFIHLNFFIQIIQFVITVSYDQCDSTGLNATALILNTLSGSITGFCSNISINYGNKPVSYNNQVLTWLAIPYAEPPTGNLRFKYPRPKKTWAATLDGTKPSSQCIQLYSDPQANEDCLYLNVYVPYNSYVKAVLQNNRASKLPIYIWIHGGGFSKGSAKDYDGSMLAAISNVIVVTIQFRLGAFGFLYVNGKTIKLFILKILERVTRRH